MPLVPPEFLRSRQNALNLKQAERQNFTPVSSTGRALPPQASTTAQASSSPAFSTSTKGISAPSLMDAEPAPAPAPAPSPVNLNPYNSRLNNSRVLQKRLREGKLLPQANLDSIRSDIISKMGF